MNQYISLKNLNPSPASFYLYAGIDIAGDDAVNKIQPAAGINMASDDDANDVKLPVNKRRKATNCIPREIEMSESSSVGSSLPETPTPTRGQSLSPTELFKRRCGNCPMCTRADCNKCATCILNACRSRRNKEVCLRKVRDIVTVAVHASFSCRN
jgi:hypothetical protein